MTGIFRVAGWWAALAAVALVCLWSAADRLAGRGLLVRGPAPLLTGGAALTARAAEASGRGDAVLAWRLARAAVARRPVDAATLRVAGFAAAAAGEDAAGGTLLRLAGAAGWRDQPTQLYWAEIALREGAWDVAAERLDAIRRAAPPEADASAGLLHALERAPQGRAALVRRLSAPGNAWLAPYLANLKDLNAEGVVARYATVTLAGARLTAVQRGRIGWALVERGRADLAARLLRPDPTVLAFAPVDSGERPGPFSWGMPGATGLDAAVEQREGAAMLHAAATGPALLPLTSRLVRLPPGRWRLAMRVAGAHTNLPLVATLICLAGGSAAAEVLPSAAGEAAFLLIVPPGCATQYLALAIAGEEARRGADLWIAAPTLVRAAASAS